MEISPIFFCRTAKLVQSTLPCEKRYAEESFPRLRIENFSAMFQRELRCTRAVWKTSQDRAFYACKFLNAEGPCLVIVFRRAMRGFFVIRFFRKSRYAPLSEKDARWQAFIRVPFFKRKAVVIVCFKTCRDGVLRYLKLLPSGAKRHLSKSCRYRNRKIYLRLLEYRFLRRKLLLSCVLWRAMTGFYKRTIFWCRGAKAYSTAGITIEWLTTIEQCKVAKYG